MDKTYTLDELSSASGVPARKIRFYIQNGLVPRPLGTGRKSRYAEAHLATLQVVVALRNERLPLDVIREYLSGYDPANLHASGMSEEAEADAAPDVSAFTNKEGAASSGAFRGLKGPPLASAVLAFVAEKRAAVSSAVHKAAHRGGRDHDVAVADDGRRTPTAADLSTWRRLSVSPDVELHVTTSYLARLTHDAGLAGEALTGDAALGLVLQALEVEGGQDAPGTPPPGGRREESPNATITETLVHDLLVDAAAGRRTLRYADVARLMGIPTRGQSMGTKVGGLLDEVCEEEVREGRPMLSALVVGYTGRPGKGFFALAEALGRLKPSEDQAAFWARELEAVYDTWRRTGSDA
jgi:DNA-binding transcriptional MerR regulator